MLTIFLTRTFGIGLPRLMLTVVALCGLSASAAAIRRTSSVRAVTVVFGWCVDDSVFPFCLWCLLNFLVNFENVTWKQPIANQFDVKNTVTLGVFISSWSATCSTFLSIIAKIEWTLKALYLAFDANVFSSVGLQGDFTHLRRNPYGRPVCVFCLKPYPIK